MLNNTGQVDVYKRKFGLGLAYTKVESALPIEVAEIIRQIQNDIDDDLEEPVHDSFFRLLDEALDIIEDGVVSHPDGCMCYECKFIRLARSEMKGEYHERD